MPRFYCPPPLPLGEVFDLPPDAAHHAARVLRLREGDAVEIFDGQGRARSGVIAAITGKRVSLDRLADAAVERESPLRTVLAQSLLSSEKMDWVVQKAVELGVTEIQPLDTARSVARLTAERAEKRMAHWRQVALSACEQCGRNVLPEIHPPQEIRDWLERMRDTHATKLILLPDGATPLQHHTPLQQGVLLLVGAEGGFDPAEQHAALECGFAPIRMGVRVLRTETAALAGLAAVQTLWGDFRA